MSTSVSGAPLTVPSLSTLFVTWLRIGATSYGGGPVVQYLIQENFIHKNRWLTAEEYSRILAMSQLTPGITLVAISILLGKRLGGWPGIVLSVAGFILPSVAITVAMTAVYAGLREQPPVQAALRGLFAAIVGVSIASMTRNLRPILAANRKRGNGMLLVALAILLGSAAAYLLLNPPVIWLYAAGCLIGAVAYVLSARRQGEA